LSKRLFDWNEYKEGNILVVFSNYSETLKFCQMALQKDLSFLNKKTSIQTTYDAISESNWRLGLACNKSDKMIRKDKKIWGGEVIHFNQLQFLEYSHAKKTPTALGSYTLNDFFERKIAINCKTEVEAKMLFRTLKRQGWTWAGGQPLDENNTYWEQHEDETVYNGTDEDRGRNNKRKRIRYGSAKYAESSLNFKVVNFKEVIY